MGHTSDSAHLLRCDNKAFKKLMSNFGSSRSEESCSAVVELLERVTRLQKELELKESRDELDVEQVETDLRLTRVGCCSALLLEAVFTGRRFFTLWSFCGCELSVEVVMKAEVFRR